VCEEQRRRALGQREHRLERRPRLRSHRDVRRESRVGFQGESLGFRVHGSRFQGKGLRV